MVSECPECGRHYLEPPENGMCEYCEGVQLAESKRSHLLTAVRSAIIPRKGAKGSPLPLIVAAIIALAGAVFLVTWAL